MATDPGKPFWMHAGRTPTFPTLYEGKYTTGEGTWGSDTTLSTHNNDRASRVSGHGPSKEAFHRSQRAFTESGSARYSVSPSAKIPTNEPQASLAGSTKIIRSKGRRASFGAGQVVGY